MASKAIIGGAIAAGIAVAAIAIFVALSNTSELQLPDTDQEKSIVAYSTKIHSIKNQFMSFS